MNRWFEPTLGLINLAFLVAMLAFIVRGEIGMQIGCFAGQMLCWTGMHYREAFQ